MIHEIDIGDSSNIEMICDEFEVFLPGYFNCLDMNEIKVLTNSEMNTPFIIGCGRSTNEGDIELLTNNGVLLTLSAKKFSIPPGGVTPIESGTKINVGNTHTVTTIWLIDHAERMIMS